MSDAKAEYVVDRVDAEHFEPDIIDGTQVGEFHQIEPKGNQRTSWTQACGVRTQRRRTICSRGTRLSTSSKGPRP